MSMIEQAFVKAKELRNRVFETIDAFRPKILIKKPLTEYALFKQEIITGEGITGLLEKIRKRIKEIRIGGEATTTTKETSESQAKSMVSRIMKEDKKVGIHY